MALRRSPTARPTLDEPDLLESLRKHLDQVTLALAQPPRHEDRRWLTRCEVAVIGMAERLAQARRAREDGPADLIELGALVGQVLETEAPESRVPIAWTRPPRPTLLHGDPRDLSLLIANAVRNAVEAAASRAEVQLSREGDRVLLEVRDDGPGVAPEARSRAFEPLHSTRPEAAGLGLAVVDGVARAHGGTARLLDGPGGRLRIELPAAPF